MLTSDKRVCGARCHPCVVNGVLHCLAGPGAGEGEEELRERLAAARFGEAQEPEVRAELPASAGLKRSG